jgi:hypothetical protein
MISPYHPVHIDMANRLPRPSRHGTDLTFFLRPHCLALRPHLPIPPHRDPLSILHLPLIALHIVPYHQRSLRDIYIVLADHWVSGFAR